MSHPIAWCSRRECRDLEHLARHRLADLFLDTLPYNAHTTASDALWAGLPLVTCVGNTFPGRVAGSLLRAIGLGELITTTLDEYEALALRLAREPEMLARLRARLEKNRLTHPLFDTARFAGNIETAYRRMWETWKAGGPPAAFAVSPPAATMPAVKNDLCVRRRYIATLAETARAKMPQPPSIARLLGKTMVDVVDVGVNPIDGTAPYQRLLDDGLARLVGFEPNLDALAKLNKCGHMFKEAEEPDRAEQHHNVGRVLTRDDHDPALQLEQGGERPNEAELPTEGRPN